MKRNTISIEPGKVDKDIDKNEKPKKRDHRFDTLRFILLFGVFSWHIARCGARPICVPQPELIQLWGENSWLRYLTRYAFGPVSVISLCFISGTVIRGKHISWNSIILPAALALVVEYLFAFSFDLMMPPGFHSSAGHAWFLWTLSASKLLIKMGNKLKLSRTLLFSIALFLHVFTSFLLPPLTKFYNDWYAVFSTRIFTHIVFVVLGYVSSETWYDNFPSKLILPVGIPLQIFLAHTHIGYSTFGRAPWSMFIPLAPEQLFLSTCTIIMTLIMLKLIPNKENIWSRLGRYTLFPYLAHPLILKLIRDPVEKVVVDSSKSFPNLITPIALFYLLVFPMLFLLSLSVPFMFEHHLINELNALKLWTLSSVLVLVYVLIRNTILQTQLALLSALACLTVCVFLAKNRGSIKRIHSFPNTFSIAMPLIGLLKCMSSIGLYNSLPQKSVFEQFSTSR